MDFDNGHNLETITKSPEEDCLAAIHQLEPEMAQSQISHIQSPTKPASLNGEFAKLGIPDLNKWNYLESSELEEKQNSTGELQSMFPQRELETTIPELSEVCSEPSEVVNEWLDKTIKTALVGRLC
ncbi:hypothetical protein QFC24_006144 [Naganishia onofrii]|uniref:Uncharacterized protein n=1 Tax=Naganishia onofrii TaxID=1851511 RepID=A0ACC2X385_9TREE|nr:hypothetical protein QFC24_006144 [Naganishia onofrii]